MKIMVKIPILYDGIEGCASYKKNILHVTSRKGCYTLHLGERCLCWAKGDLAQARWARLSQASQVSHCSTFAQARKLSLSKTGLVAEAKASSPSEFSAVFVCCLYVLMRTWIRRSCAMRG